MKQVLLILAGFMLTFSAKAQKIDDFLKSLEKGDVYGVVTVNKEMFKLFASMDVDTEEESLKELVKDINMLKVYIHEEGADYADYEKLQGMAESSNMVELMSVKDGSERVKLYTRNSDNSEIVEDILLLVRDADQNVFIKLDGKINLKHLSKLTKSMNIDGIEHLNLDKIENKKRF